MKRVAIDNVSVLQDNKGVWFRGTLIAGKTKGKRTATMLMFFREQKKNTKQTNKKQPSSTRPKKLLVIQKRPSLCPTY